MSFKFAKKFRKKYVASSTLPLPTKKVLRLRIHENMQTPISAFCPPLRATQKSGLQKRAGCSFLLLAGTPFCVARWPALMWSQLAHSLMQPDGLPCCASRPSAFQRWSDSGFLLSDPTLFLKKDIRTVSDPNPVLVEIILSVSKNYPKVYCDAQHAFLYCVYFAFSWTRLVEEVTW